MCFKHVFERQINHELTFMYLKWQLSQMNSRNQTGQDTRNRWYFIVRTYFRWGRLGPLEARGIGTHHALFFEAWAHCLETSGAQNHFEVAGCFLPILPVVQMLRKHDFEGAADVPLPRSCELEGQKHESI